MGTSCKKIQILKKIRKEIRKKIQEDTFNDPVSTPYGKANSSLRPDSFLKSLVILKMFALAALVQKFVRMTSDLKKLFTGPGRIIYYRRPSVEKWARLPETAEAEKMSWLDLPRGTSYPTFPYPRCYLKARRYPPTSAAPVSIVGMGGGGGGGA